MLDFLSLDIIENHSFSCYVTAEAFYFHLGFATLLYDLSKGHISKFSDVALLLSVDALFI
jgi:hypothetical protein